MGKNNIYIGARYVPLIKGEYDPSIAYEPLTIVIYNSNSYTSRKQVPAGIYPTNSEYWALTGNYNAQLQKVEETVSNMKVEVDKIPNLEKEINKIPTLELEVNKIPPLEKDVASIKKEIENITVNNNINMIMIGDSYGEQTDGSISSWYWEQIRDNLGLINNKSFYSKFLSGAGFGNGEFLSNLQSLEKTITNKKTITDILVCGGWNDSDKSQTYGSDSAYQSGVLNFNKYVKETYPNATITIAHISWGDSKLRNSDDVYNQMPVSRERYTKSASKYGWRYILNAEYILHSYQTGMWQADGAHPGQTGQNELANYLTSGFLTGACDVYRQTGYVVPTFSNSSSKPLYIFNKQHNGTIESTAVLSGSTSYIQFSPAQTIDCNGVKQFTLGSCDQPLCRGNGAYTLVNVPAIATANNKQFIGNLSIEYNNKGEFRTRLLAFSADGGGNQAVSFLWLNGWRAVLNAYDC